MKNKTLLLLFVCLNALNLFADSTEDFYKLALQVNDIVVANKTACDFSSSNFYIRNLETKELELFYQYTSECGENDLRVVAGGYYVKIITSLLVVRRS